MKKYTVMLIAALGLANARVHADEPMPACHMSQAAAQQDQHASESEQGAGNYRAPAVHLVDQSGAQVDLVKLLATTRPIALNFIFTSCRTICPVLSASLASLHRQMGDEVDYVSISIDPEFDTPAQLRGYQKRFDVGPHWTLLTGKLEDVIAVQKAFDAYYGGKNGHKALTFTRPAGSRDWKRFEGFPATAELASSLRAKMGAAEP